MRVAGWTYTTVTPDGYYGSSMSQNNGGDQIFVFNNNVDPTSSTFAWSGSDAGVSRQLDGGLLDSTSAALEASWCNSTNAFESEFGTPGAANMTCAPAPVP